MPTNAPAWGRGRDPAGEEDGPLGVLVGVGAMDEMVEERMVLSEVVVTDVVVTVEPSSVPSLRIQLPSMFTPRSVNGLRKQVLPRQSQCSLASWE